jgi:uncharacterized protein YebE (UPF0316 family)
MERVTDIVFFFCDSLCTLILKLLIVDICYFVLMSNRVYLVHSFQTDAARSSKFFHCSPQILNVTSVLSNMISISLIVVYLWPLY